ncbi:MAG: O-antigen polysaccharide polymerase Wzy [Bacteroidia bacterium]|nr:O-antigen polysaccharide polymerase Wzy [Bacteroidia bacterium]
MTKEVSIMYLMSALAILQWLVGPVVYFSDLNPGMTFEITKMQVGYEEYFDFALPATISFCIGLCLFKVSDHRLDSLINRIKENLPALAPWAKRLIVFAFIADTLVPFTPGAIRQYVLFLGYLKYLGFCVLLLTAIYYKSRSAYLYLGLSILLILISTVKALMFGELVFAIALIALIVLPFIKTRLIYRLSAIFLLTTLVVGIQLIKPMSRAYMWDSRGDTSFVGLYRVIKSSNILSLKNVKSEGFVGYSIARFNQGSVVSWTMSRVPKKVPFENGKTVVSSSLGSFIPRLVWPNKPVAGKAMYEKYTGLKLVGASYGISQLGEAYVNFGVKGGIIFMFFLGLVFNLIQNRIVLNSEMKLSLLFILPILFLHGIKVETDITRSLGFIIRFLIFIGIINMFLKALTAKTLIK